VLIYAVYRNEFVIDCCVMCWKALVCFESGYIISVYDVDILMLLQLMLEMSGNVFESLNLPFPQFVPTLSSVPMVIPVPSRCWSQTTNRISQTTVHLQFPSSRA